MSRQGPGPPQTSHSTAMTQHTWPPGVTDGIWAPLVAGGITLFFGLAVVLIGYISFFPGLASTIYLVAANPEQPSARLYNVIVGHFIALLAGYLMVIALGLTSAPSAIAINALTLPRVYASTAAMTLTVAAGLAARASHPPAATTAILIALGTIPATWQAALGVAASILIVGVAVEVFRRLRLYGSLRGHPQL